MNKNMNLVIGILLSLLVVAVVGSKVISGSPFTPAFIALQVSLLLFATSRFIMFKSPDSAAARPLRMLALLVFAGYFLLKFQH